MRGGVFHLPEVVIENEQNLGLLFFLKMLFIKKTTKLLILVWLVSYSHTDLLWHAIKMLIAMKIRNCPSISLISHFLFVIV